MTPIHDTLLAIIEGSRWATVLRDNGRPGRIALPDDPAERRALVDAHLVGAPAELAFHARDAKPWRERVAAAVVIGGYCPGADGLCRWLACDLDGVGHGPGGLADPLHAAPCIAERAENAGLGDGLLVARSKSGGGIHVWLILPEPTPLADCVLAVAALAVQAARVAGEDVTDYDDPPAFRRGTGAVAQPGDAGAVELFPRSDARPEFGWPLTLPGAGAFRERGGGIIINPWTGEPAEPERVPRCQPEAWARFVREARTAFASAVGALRRKGARR